MCASNTATLDKSSNRNLIEDYLIYYSSSLNTLRAEQSYFLSIAQNVHVTRTERAFAIAGYEDIASQIALLKTAHDSIMNRFRKGVKAPSVEMIKKSFELTKDLAEKIHTATTASTILEIVASFVDGWTTLLTP